MRLPADKEILQPPAGDQGLICAVDLGGTHLRAAIIDTQGKFINRLKERTPLTDNPGDIVRALAMALKDCQHVSAALRDQVRSLSIVVPGVVDAKSGKVIKAPNLPCLDGFHLADTLADELHLPVILENDGNAAAIGEMWQGGARGRRSFVFVTLGTGVGGGIILDGKLWRGANNSAAEIGHMSVEPFDGVACGCGSRGCLEVYASATAIVRMAREANLRYSASCLQIGEGLTAEEVYRAGKQGDALAIEVFHRMGGYLGVGLANLINILNPEMIVIGGGVANGWDLFAHELRRQVDEHAFPLPTSEVQIVLAECGDDAGLLGAALLGFWEQSKREVPALLHRS
ncbi:MAG TPA: ROK family protein [Pyrinomonadaceae bacterium]|jgi:glucokinase|nr:ROK family protein [Pyrinomonadaceae bacterium]